MYFKTHIQDVTKTPHAEFHNQVSFLLQLNLKKKSSLAELQICSVYFFPDETCLSFLLFFLSFFLSFIRTQIQFRSAADDDQICLLLLFFFFFFSSFSRDKYFPFCCFTQTRKHRRVENTETPKQDANIYVCTYVRTTVALRFTFFDDQDDQDRTLLYVRIF